MRPEPSHREGGRGTACRAPTGAHPISTRFIRLLIPHLLAFWAIVLLSVTGSTPAFPAEAPALRPASSPSGTVLVPDRFLRRWDAVTVFFDKDIGRPGVAEDHPERLVTVSPPHPGAYTWLDSRTLQFRPADPWPPLTRFRWTADGHTATLATLMEAPAEILPAPNSEGLEPVDAITLTFAEPLPPEALAQMVTVELRLLPGIKGVEGISTGGTGGKGESRWLTREDFEVKTLERRSPSDKASYVLQLHSPIPLGMRATVHLRLSLEDEPARAFAEYTFATATPFRVTTVGGGNMRFPVAPGGTRYTRDQAINADTDNRAVVLEFSATPGPIDPVHGRNLVRITPPVDKLDFRTEGKTLEVHGDFLWDTLYSVAVTKSDVKDQDGRPLEMDGESEVFVYFPRRAPYLHLKAAQGVVERFGPKNVPLEGRGFDRFDLRIYRIDPLDRSFWPFPEQPVTVDESHRPPGPGEAPEPFREPSHYPSRADSGAHRSARLSPGLGPGGSAAAQRGERRRLRAGPHRAPGAHLRPRGAGPLSGRAASARQQRRAPVDAPSGDGSQPDHGRRAGSCALRGHLPQDRRAGGGGFRARGRGLQ